MENEKILYRKFPPCKQLQSYVSCFWSLTSTNAIRGSVLNRVIPDGCIDIVFDLSDSPYTSTTGVVAGTMTKPIMVPLKNKAQIIGVRFLPGGASHFLDYPMQAFTDKLVPLDKVFMKKDCEIIMGGLVRTNPVGNKIKAFENHLKNCLKKNRKKDMALNNALQIISGNKGNISVSELAQQIDISHRQLNRKFATWIGVSPKVFCRIIRFQSVLKAISTASGREILFTALDGGYYDQSHFIHEFNSLYGSSPSKLSSPENN